MKIILNNKEEIFDGELLTINDLLKLKNYTFRMLVVKINDKLGPKDDYDHAVITDGDHVMVLHLISGG